MEVKVGPLAIPIIIVDPCLTNLLLVLVLLIGQRNQTKLAEWCSQGKDVSGITGMMMTSTHC